MTPLAERIRPQSFNEVFGQSHIIGENAPLTKMLDKGILPNMIFYGPPGTGKTTVANIIATGSNMALKKLNATMAGTKDIKEILAESDMLFFEKGILLYIDEIQYLNKKQQQTLLEFIENGKVTLIASTTENPYFYIYKAILSRSTLFEFKPLSQDDCKKAISRGIDKLNEESGEIKTVEENALDILSGVCAGDLRSGLNTLEIAYHMAEKEISAEDIKSVMPKGSVNFDRGGDAHFELMSALQKSIRGSDENAAIFYLAKLLEGGDLFSACRRLLVIASEDIGLAYPQAAAIVKALVDSALQVGLPEAEIPLAHAAILLATSPKSNSAYMALHRAKEDIAMGYGGDMPSRLKNNHCFGEGDSKDEYLYPHNFNNSYVAQQYLPDDIKDRKYYVFGNNKNENAAKDYWEKIKGNK